MTILVFGPDVTKLCDNKNFWYSCFPPAQGGSLTLNQAEDRSQSKPVWTPWSAVLVLQFNMGVMRKSQRNLEKMMTETLHPAVALPPHPMSLDGMGWFRRWLP